MATGEEEVTETLLKKTTENGREDDELGMREMFWRESKKLWVVAGPAIFTRFSTSGLSLISQAFIGHLGPTELAAYSITLTVLLRFSNGILLGMASALETLCGQAYGAKQYHMLGIYLQRSWIVLTGCTICLIPIYIFAGPILLALGQEERLVRVARIIALWVIGINISFVPSFTCQMFLQAQSKNKIIAYVAAVSLGVHVFLSWLLVVHFDFGIAGAMTSSLVAHWLPNIAQLLFVTCGGCKDTWRGFSWLAFKDLWPVFKLSASSGGMICLELWYNSILILLTGNLKNAEVALNALAICININALEMMVAFGFMAAARKVNTLFLLVLVSGLLSLASFSGHGSLLPSPRYLISSDHGAASLSSDHHIANIDRLVRNRIVSYRRLYSIQYSSSKIFTVCGLALVLKWPHSN